MREVVGGFAGGEDEVLGGGAAELEQAGGDLGPAGGGRLGDGGRRAVDAEHPARVDAAGDLARRGAGAAADLEHPRARKQRQRVDGCPEAWRERGHRAQSGITAVASISTSHSGRASADTTRPVETGCTPRMYSPIVR